MLHKHTSKPCMCMCVFVCRVVRACAWARACGYVFTNTCECVHILPYTSFVSRVLFGYSRGMKRTRLLALRTFAFLQCFDHYCSHGANGSNHPSCFCFHDLGTTSITLRAKIDFRFGMLVPYSNLNVYNLSKAQFSAFPFHLTRLTQLQFIDPSQWTSYHTRIHTHTSPHILCML